MATKCERTLRKALEYFKTGAKLGNYFCLLELAAMFVKEGHAENAIKAFSRFVEQGSADQWKSYAAYSGEHAFRTYHLLVSAAISQPDLYPQLGELSAPFHQSLRAYAETTLKERQGKEAVSLTGIRRRLVEDLTRAERRHA